MMTERVVDCPECHVTCGWCSWYAKNARAIGCGVQPFNRRRKKCDWGEALKGTTCALCGGVEKVHATVTYAPIPPPTRRPEPTP